MTPELETPIGHRELIRRMLAQKAAEAKAASEASDGPAPPNQNSPAEDSPVDHAPEDKIGGKRCRIHAFRHETTGQFYAMSHEDRRAFDQHSKGILEDCQPESASERWLATSIAEDQWRLNRARAVENNIFAMGMSGAIGDATNADSPEVHAAVCHARVWLADGKNLQGLTLYEQRIRRLVEKNQKELKQIQAERKAIYDKALEEAKLLAWLAIVEEGEEYDPAEDFPAGNGFGFSALEINRIVRREMRLQKAAQLQQQAANQTKAPERHPFHKPQAA